MVFKLALIVNLKVEAKGSDAKVFLVGVNGGLTVKVYRDEGKY
jgi:hypothetical protein